MEQAADFSANYEALVQGAGFRAAPERMVVRITGDDRIGFMHGICTNDIKRLAPGDAVYSLLLTEHAHVIADFHILATDRELWLVVERKLWARARENLERFLVADDVEFEEDTSCAVLEVMGPRAGAAAGSILGEAVAALAPWRFAEIDGAVAAGIPRLGEPGVMIVAEANRRARLLSNLRAVEGAREVDEAALETVRVEHGIARVGVDTAEKTIALEARLESAISFNKGCYLGQETIERATARGGLKKKLFGLRFADVGKAGAPLTLDGKEVGRVSSAVQSPRMGALGLAILHHSAWTPGTRLVCGNSIATVCDLPFR